MKKDTKMKKEDNIIVKLWNKVTIEKWQKVLRLIIICMVFMVVSEGIFEIPVIRDFFGAGLIEGKSGWIVYVIVWLVMFAQVAIIPIPALPILTACNQIPNFIAHGTGIGDLFSMRTIGFVILITSATTIGAIASYWLGRTFGKPAIKWVAGSDSDYKLWVKKLNSKTGRWLYAATVLFPLFPDDLISFVVGSIKMNFSFYFVTNVVCKAIGLYTVLIFMRLRGLDVFFGNADPAAFPIALVVYACILLASIIVRAVLNRILKLKQPKSMKLEDLHEDLVKKFTKKISSSKELIIDYKLDKNFKTYLNVNCNIEKLYETNDKNEKEKVRVIIKCQASNYWEIVFDKTYELTATYNKLLEDIKLCKF